MSVSKAAFVLVHGGWHSHSAWDRVVPILNAQGYAALTLDFPGAGVTAIAPTSLSLRPFDPAAFAVERSPIAGVTQEERTQAVVALVREAASLGDGTPNRFRSCFSRLYTLPNSYCRTACRCSRCSSMRPCLRLSGPGCLWATPPSRARQGSMSDRPTTPTDRLKAAFYGDVSDSEFAHAASQLHCHEPVGAVTPSGIMPGRFGTVITSAAHRIARFR
jgi:hypothetical protein